MNIKLGILDYVLVAASMILSVTIGLYFSNKNKNIDSYMLGDKKMSVLPVAVSLMTSCMSGLTLLGSSAEFYYQGPTYAFVAMAIFLSGPIIAYTVLPVFYRLNELSLYKYLQLRFGSSIKYVSSIVFVLQMVFYNAVVLYLPAMALEAVIGLSRMYSILLIGMMCVLYSGIGGLKAVVWTDFFQAILMYASVIVVGVLGTYDAGGVGELVEKAREGGRLNLDGFFDLSLTTRHTFWGILVGSTVKHVFIVGVNQVQMQRAIALSSLKKAQNSFIICGVLTALISLLSSYLGLVLYSAYESCDPYLSKEIPRRDSIIVHYVARRLSKVVGLRGIFIAGLFSATLSTLSSFSNSMAAISLEDFIKPIMKKLELKEFSNSRETLIAKILATIFGLICVLMAYVIDKAQSRLLQATTTLFGALGVPFLACFFMGIFTRFANCTGILVSLIVTVSLGIYYTIRQVFFEPGLEPQMPVYYDKQCERVFNMSQPFGTLPPLAQVFEGFNADQPLPQVSLNLTLAHISYMTFPAVQLVLTIAIATIVSLITGGWNQEVDDDYLVSMLHKRSLNLPARNEVNELYTKQARIGTPSCSKFTTIGSTINGSSSSILPKAQSTHNADSDLKLPLPATIDTFRSQLGEITSDSLNNGRRRKMGTANRAFDSNDDLANDANHVDSNLNLK